nr:helix-turn-helix domain-containing protein [Brevibacillus fulvus]
MLIADRDPYERTGLNWLIHSYGLPFDRVLLAESAMALIEHIETSQPEIICMELDMVPKELWERTKAVLRQYRPVVLVMTAEATFERALQGIELHAWDLWVKPLSPDQIRRVLSRLSRRAQEAKANPAVSAAGEARQAGITYRSLFLPGESAGRDLELMLLQLENTAKHPLLLSFLEEYPFRQMPVLLPLSDLIVCIFPQMKENSLVDLTLAGKRLLADWESASAEPLSLIIYTSTDQELTLHQKYLYAKQALEIRFFRGYRQISVVEDRMDWLMIDPFLTPAEQRTWIGMLNDADKQKIKGWMYQEFLNRGEPYPEPGLLRIRLTSILAQIRRYMLSFCMGDLRLEEKYHRVFETILYTPILYRIVQELLLFVFEVLEVANSKQEHVRTDVVEQAIRYMEEHFHEPDLRLEDVAAHVDRSPAYFSALLSKKMGTSFRQLLTSMRIKEAERLLMTGKLTVQEVAERAGFGNSNYFSKVFKEKTGTTPRSLRNRK